MIDRRIAICVAASIGSHVLAGEVLSSLPERTAVSKPRKIEVRVVTPPPPPPPPEPTPPPPPPAATVKPPPPKVVERATPRPRPTPRPVPTEPPPTTTPAPAAPVSSTTTATGSPTQPVFGVSMESTTTTGGPAVRTGNSAVPGTTDTPSAERAGPVPGAPVPAHEVTKLPMPRGRCSGAYTEAAREAGIEGVVILELVVDAQGRPRDIKVVEGLPHGLTEAALKALRACTFTPGERDGVAVPVRVRQFKIRFVLDT